MCVLDIGLPLLYTAFSALSTVSTVQSFNVTLAAALLHCGTRAPSSITANMDTCPLFHFTLLEKLPIFNTVCVLCRHVGHTAVATHARHVAQGPGQHQTCAGHVTRVGVGQQLSRDDDTCALLRCRHHLSPHQVICTRASSVRCGLQRSNMLLVRSYTGPELQSGDSDGDGGGG